MKPRYLLYLLLLLPVFIFRDYTPANELKYLSIVEEAIGDHHWITFYHHGVPYADKPPLYFWWIMLTRIATGGYHLWLIGLMSLLPAVGVMAVMDKWLKAEKIAYNPLVSNLMLGTTAIFVGSAVVLRMDMLMVFFITLSLYTFFRIYKNRCGPAEKYLFPVYVFLAVFSKGVVGFMVPFFSVLLFLAARKRLREFGRYFGWRQWIILVGLCSVWFSLVYSEGGSEYLNNILFKQTVGRGINSFHHKEPFYYYFYRIFFTFAPWSLLYVYTLVKGGIRRAFASDTEKLFAIVIVSTLLVMSLVSSKLDIYLLPVYPFVAYLTSILIARSGGSAMERACVAIPAAILALAFPAAVVLIGRIDLPGSPWPVLSPVFLLSAGGLAALVCLFRRKNIYGAITALSLGMLSTIFTSSFGIGRYNDRIGLGPIAAEAKATAEKNGIGEYRYYIFNTAQNMDVYLGKPVTRIDTVEQLDSIDQSSPEKILFVRTKDIRKDPEFARWLESRKDEATLEPYRVYIIGRKE